MQSSIVTVLLLVGSLTLMGQDYKDELKVGDRLPALALNNMINYPSKTLKFADHHPKLTILDIWSTTCSGCVAALPKMLSLQKEFDEDLQIIMVDRSEDEKFVKDFLAHRKKLTGIDVTLPISCKDTDFKKLFPRRGLPRYYWIDSNGVLSSVTHGDQVNSANIKRWIQSGPFPLDQIIEDMQFVKGNKPIFVDGNGGTGRSEAFLWSSSLTKGVRDVVGGSVVYTNPISGYGICATGASVGVLYGIAYNNRLSSARNFTFIHGSRLILDDVDTSKYYSRVPGIGTQPPSYNYQLISGQPMEMKGLQETMQEDLKRYFGLAAGWEKRKLRCLVISMFDSTKAKGESKSYARFVGETHTALDSVTVQEAIWYMENGAFFYDRRPIVDDTGFKGLLLGIRFEANCTDIIEFDKALSRFGMHIKEEIRETDVLVLREPEKSN